MPVLTKTHFQQLFEYDAWANAKVLGMLREIVTDHARARGLLAHTLAAQLVWMTRLHEHDSSGIAIWPDHTLDQCEAWLDHNRQAYAEFLRAAAEETLGQQITYVNTRGEKFSTPIDEVLLHVANHGSYHRGQIALAMREAGHTPVNTDFITWTRRSRETSPKT